jgi:hypothetical protein
MLDLRRPKRTSTESMAQPMAEKIATISANNEVKSELDSWHHSDKPTTGEFANVAKRDGRVKNHYKACLRQRVALT